VSKRSLVVLLGNVGAGKTTQARKLVQDYGLTYLGTGELLRDEVQRQTELGRELQERLAAGLFASDEQITAIVASRLVETDNLGFVLDGFPRTLTQAKWLADLVDADPELDLAPIYFDVSEDDCRERLLRRGQVSNPRPEDSVEVIPRRFEEYHRQTAPILSAWQDCCLYIGAGANSDVVYNRLVLSLQMSHALATPDRDLGLVG